MGKETIKIAYCGPAVDEGVMDVRDLAPALMAMGQMLEESNRIINGNDSRVKVLVRSDIRRGSFEVSMEVISSLSEQVRLLLGSCREISIKEVLELLGLASTITGCSLISLIKKLRGKKPRSAVTLENGNVRLEIDSFDGVETVEVSESVIKLYTNMPVRKKMEEVLRPLEKEDMTAFEVRSSASIEKETIASVSREEAKYFVTPDIPECEPVVSERTALLHIHSLSFDEDNKWRLDDGDNKYWVTILDAEFLDDVNNRRIVFAKGDTLEVVLRTTQCLTSKGIKNEYSAVKVNRVIPKPGAITLF